MKIEILQRIKALGGNIDRVQGKSLQADLLSITFDTVLYPRPQDAPWATADEQEPICDLGELINVNEALFKRDKAAFYQMIIDHYYCLTEEGYGQTFWQPLLFTPFKAGTDDYQEWHDLFSSDKYVNLSEFEQVTGDKTPDFLQLFYSYGFPDRYYICLSDPNPENPTVFGTDREAFFLEVSNEGTLEDFLHSFMTKEELIAIIKKEIE